MFILENGCLYVNRATAIQLVKLGSCYREEYIEQNIDQGTWTMSPAVCPLNGILPGKESLLTHMGDGRYLIVPENEAADGRYEVIVSNVGNVYSGHSKEAANKIFDEYVALTKVPGRAQGESVELFDHKTGEQLRTHESTIDPEFRRFEELGERLTADENPI